MTVFNVEQADAVEWLRKLPDGEIDLVCTDAAYESLEKHRAVGTTTRLKRSKSSSNDWFPIFKNERFEELFVEVHRVLAKNAHCYMFCDQETMFIVKPIGEKVGFKFWKGIVWNKLSVGLGYHWRAKHEMILFFEKGKRKLNKLGEPDVLDVKRVHNGYPTEKPVELLERLIANSSQPGETVVDPFMGSGSTGVAALKLGRNFLGCDVQADAVEHARKRLAEVGAVA